MRKNEILYSYYQIIALIFNILNIICFVGLPCSGSGYGRVWWFLWFPNLPRGKKNEKRELCHFVVHNQ
jgi:hypothetical protein